MINWNVRYSRILNLESNIHNKDSSILEIGPGNMGLANFMNKRITGVQPNFDYGHHPNLDPINGSADNLPFTDDLFDYTLCIDVLEHLPLEIRGKALSEILRVTKKNAWLTFPSGIFARSTELSLSESFSRLNIASPDWLLEHINNGIPEISDILHLLDEMNCSIKIFVNESLSEHFSGLLADLLFPAFKNFLQHKSKKVNSLNPFLTDPLDYPYSIGIKISKKVDSLPVVSNSFNRSSITQKDGVSIFLGSHIHIPSNVLLNTPNLIPIYLGDASNSARRSGLTTDILKNGSSLQNNRWCELSGIYKLWKEVPKIPYIGFCHYRRIFNFSKTHSSLDNLDENNNFGREQVIASQDLDSIAGHISPNLNLFNGFIDIIVPPPVKIPNNIFTHYCAEHVADDMLEVISIIYNNQPSFKKITASSTSDNYLYCNNMFVMKADLFDNLCSFWFNILFEFERNNPHPKSLVNNQGRDIAFLSERVFDIWIKQMIKEGCNVHYSPIYKIAFPNVLSDEWSPTKF
jgi:hypothetical protein